MLNRRVVSLMCVVAGLGTLARETAAQPLGTFRWQQQPYCNVLTLSVTQSGGVFLLDGYDDECGGPRRASAVGIAFLNLDGSVGMGLTVVSVGGTPVHLDATVSLATLNGTWHDNAAQSGAWTFTPGASSGGTSRPAPRPLFSTGLSVAGATIADVGPPANPGDAAPRGYVDAANAATLASARSLATKSIPLTAYSAVGVGDLIPDAGGCLTWFPEFASRRLDLLVPTGGVIQALKLKYLDDSPEAMTFSLIVANFTEGATYLTDSTVQSLISSNGSGRFRMETMTFNALPPVTSTRTYYLFVVAPAHTEFLGFCGAEVIYTIP